MSKEAENVEEKFELEKAEKEIHEINFSSKESEPEDLIRKC